VHLLVVIEMAWNIKFWFKFKCPKIVNTVYGLSKPWADIPSKCLIYVRIATTELYTWIQNTIENMLMMSIKMNIVFDLHRCGAML